jgi:hypothetical protein
MKVKTWMRMMYLWLSQVVRRSVDGALLQSFQVQPPCYARLERKGS